MAEGLGFPRCREIFVGGRPRALLNAIAYFKNERVGRGRVGRGLNIRFSNDNNERRMIRQVMRLPHAGDHNLNTLIPGPGVSHYGEGGAEASLSQHPPHLHQPNLNL